MVPVKTMLAVALPPGVKVTESVQLAPMASVVEQVLVRVKFVVLLLVRAMPVSVAVPLLVSVTVCAALVVPGRVPVKARPEVERVAVGAVAVPESVMVWVALAALVTTVIAPVYAAPGRGGRQRVKGRRDCAVCADCECRGASV